MNEYRFYVPNLLEQLQLSESLYVHLPDDQAHHARAVLRIEAGEPVVIFDGNGTWAQATMAPARGKEMAVKVLGGPKKQSPPGVELTIAAAVPKGDRAEWLVEQASQLYVWELQWLTCDRGVVKPKEGGQKMEKWRRLAIESAKQCERTHVMRVEEPKGVEEVVLAAKNAKKTIFWADFRAKNSIQDLLFSKNTPENSEKPQKVVALIGPEGGWSDPESHFLTQLVEAGEATHIHLTQTILRIETACAAIAAIIMSHPTSRERRL